jgi:hypothetical protein
MCQFARITLHPAAQRAPPRVANGHHRAAFVPRARPRAFPLERVIGPPRPGDRRTPVQRWRDWHFSWEAHFYG